MEYGEDGYYYDNYKVGKELTEVVTTAENAEMGSYLAEVRLLGRSSRIGVGLLFKICMLQSWLKKQQYAIY